MTAQSEDAGPLSFDTAIEMAAIMQGLGRDVCEVVADLPLTDEVRAEVEKHFGVIGTKQLMVSREGGKARAA